MQFSLDFGRKTVISTQVKTQLRMHCDSPISSGRIADFFAYSKLDTKKWSIENIESYRF